MAANLNVTYCEVKNQYHAELVSDRQDDEEISQQMKVIDGHLRKKARLLADFDTMLDADKRKVYQKKHDPRKQSLIVTFSILIGSFVVALVLSYLQR